MYSAETFHIIRGFGRLRMRQLRYQQRKLARAEIDLEAIDDRDAAEYPAALRRSRKKLPC